MRDLQVNHPCGIARYVASSRFSTKMIRNPETGHGSFVIDVTVDCKDLPNTLFRGDKYSYALAISAETYLFPCNEIEGRTSPASDKRLSVLYNLNEIYSGRYALHLPILA